MTTLTKQQIEFRARAKVAWEEMETDPELASIFNQKDNSIESYWANSASQSIINDYKHGNVRKVIL